MVKVDQPTGGNATIVDREYDEFNAEILSLDSTYLYFQLENSLYQMDLKKIRKITVLGYSLKSEKVAALFPLMLLDVLLATAAYSDDLLFENWVGNLAVAHATASLVSIFLGNPKVTFKPPLKEQDSNKLRLYCRYPQGLSEEQWLEILVYYRQKDFKTVK